MNKTPSAAGRFLEENTTKTARIKVKAGALYKRYVEWSEAANEPKTLSMRAFGDAMAKRGITKESSTCFWYLGIGLRAETEAEPPCDDDGGLNF